jgi:NitT/TauT family transport system ATP-binding protein
MAGSHLSSTPRIEIRSVSLSYRTTAGPFPVLDALSFSCRDQSFTAVVGPSGCGKSTLTRLIAGLLKPTSGDVLLHGEPVTGPRPTIGMAFQNPVLLEWRSIIDNVLLPLEIVPNKLNQGERVERARGLLSLVGLGGFETKRPSELSGGMRQRASLCRALVHRPELLILDEPFSGLDAFTREDLWQTLHQLRREEATTCLLITHDLREAIFLGDQVVVLSGRPATNQYVLDVALPPDRSLDDLYTPESTEMLHLLRNQIAIGQGRATAAAGKGTAS